MVAKCPWSLPYTPSHPRLVQVPKGLSRALYLRPRVWLRVVALLLSAGGMQGPSWQPSPRLLRGYRCTCCTRFAS